MYVLCTWYANHCGDHDRYGFWIMIIHEQLFKFACNRSHCHGTDIWGQCTPLSWIVEHIGIKEYFAEKLILVYLFYTILLKQIKGHLAFVSHCINITNTLDYWGWWSTWRASSETSYYLNQYWPRSSLSFGIFRPQWVKHVSQCAHIPYLNPYKKGMFLHLHTKCTLCD